MCNSWGDPHVDGFDGGLNDVYDATWYTLVEPTLEAQENESVPYFRVSQRTYEVKYVAYIDTDNVINRCLELFLSHLRPSEHSVCDGQTFPTS